MASSRELARELSCCDELKRRKRMMVGWNIPPPFLVLLVPTELARCSFIS
jgi:hypothetical protein